MKGLSFSEPMVKAWMDGRKTVTRRLVNPQPGEPCSHSYQHPAELWWTFGDNTGRVWKPRYRPGETVYIKETWAFHDPLFDDDKAESFRIAALVDQSRIIYRASSPEYLLRRWRSPRFMPEWAARSHALIVSVMQERVQEITEEDILQEGFRMENPNIFHLGYIESFKKLWESLHPGSWERNDWVWRIELEKKP